ncbi:MAG: hypothetical protein GF331_25015 [Chitinivibrionales bacterium]|nr:hypothetical protein [Chitinivibrionales bacterium]
MKLGFQHIGAVGIPLRSLFASLGVEVVQADAPNRRSAQAGVALAPETVCLPFKITLGDLVQCLELGADTLALLGSGDWSCRFGYYGRVQHHILVRRGYRFRPLFISVDNAAGIFNVVFALCGRKWTVLVYRLTRGIVLAMYKSTLVERIEREARLLRPFELRRGDTSAAMNTLLTRVDSERSPTRLVGMRRHIRAQFRAIPRDRSRQCIRVAIVGESYCVIEPYVNFNLIEFLGRHGVIAEPFLTAHRWLFRHALKLEARAECTKRRAVALARPFWAFCAGGEERIGIGWLVDAACREVDGAIHLMPFGCMAETAALPVYQTISRTYGIPLLSISLDEHSGPEGFYTRIEAFIDLIVLRRRESDA